MQCGGWTIAWQGKSGAVTKGGTTILEAIRQTVSPGTHVIHSADGSGIERADAVLVVVGEPPYAEMKGDRENLSLAPDQQDMVARVRKAGAPMILLILSGRPLVLESAQQNSDAIVAAWLPGTEGLGVTDVLFGDARPKGKLPRTWPRDNTHLGLTVNNAQASSEPLYPFGHGLTW
jgi:beta-glucosidase